MSVLQDDKSGDGFHFPHHSDMVRDQAFNNGQKCPDDPPSSVTLMNSGSSGIHLAASAGDQYESEKNAIYRHPLFPLFALLFERCEQATRSPDCASSASLKADIQLFVQHQRQILAGKSSLTEDPEVDSLMLRAIQTLRIHLLELEKVNELCRDFCTRYIACLRAKMQNEQLLHLDSFDAECVTGGAPSGVAISDLGRPRSVNADSQDQWSNEDIGTVASGFSQPNQHVHMNINRRVESAEFGQEEERRSPGRHSAAMHSAEGDMSKLPANVMASLACLDDVDIENCDMSSGMHLMPRHHAKQILKSWFIDHIAHPFPTDSDKQMIAGQTNLNVSQVENWFISARQQIAQLVGMSDVDVRAEMSSRRRWPVTEGTSRCLETDLVGAVVSQHTNDANIGSASSTPSSTTYGCGYLSPDNHNGAAEQDPGAAYRSLTKHSRSENNRMKTGGIDSMLESVDSSVDSADFSLHGNNAKIVNDS